MKTIIIVLIVLGLSFASNLRNLSSTPSPDCVIFYRGLNFTGDKNEKCQTNNKITNEKWKNKYSSVKLGSNVESLTVYSKNDFEGNTLTYRSDQADLGPLNDDIQSYTINTKFSDDCVRFWESRHLMGDSWTVCKSKTSINTNKQDKFNYVQFGANIYKIGLYNKTYYSNKPNTSLEIKLSGGNVFDNQFRSLQIHHDTLPDNCVWLFQAAGYTGPFLELCNWTSDIGSKGGAIGSIWLGDNIDSVTVYDQTGYQGDSNTYTYSKSSLGTWHNRIYSIKLY